MTGFAMDEDGNPAHFICYDDKLTHPLVYRVGMKIYNCDATGFDGDHQVLFNPEFKRIHFLCDGMTVGGALDYIRGALDQYEDAIVVENFSVRIAKRK